MKIKRHEKELVNDVNDLEDGHYFIILGSVKHKNPIKMRIIYHILFITTLSH